MYYRNAKAAIVVFDITVRDTFERAQEIVQKLLVDFQGANLVIAFIANKCDLDPVRTVTSKEGQQYANDNGLIYMETSAKTGHNINELFTELALRVHQYYGTSMNNGNNGNNGGPSITTLMQQQQQQQPNNGQQGPCC